MRENIKVIIEVSGGCVIAVYAGNAEQPMIDAYIVDHDSAAAAAISDHQPLVAFHAADVRSYDGAESLPIMSRTVAQIDADDNHGG